MKARLATYVGAIGLLAALAIPIRVAAHGGQYPYILVDLGTFGGPQDGQGNGPYLSNTGLVAGTADTATHDPYYPNENSSFNEDPYIQHTFLWRKGILTDLGALPGTSSSYPNGINARGDEAGVSDNGVINPLTHLPEVVAILWKDHRIINLGTLGGNESSAFALNDRDQVTGVAQNAIPDPLSMLGLGTQTRAFLWQDGMMRDLGTLGGPDAFGWFMNERGQVAGVSYTNAIVNPVTGQPQTDPFLWQDGVMRDLGTLGGPDSMAVFMNNRGQIAGQSYTNTTPNSVTGQPTMDPFLWENGHMRDLGTLGGTFGFPNSMNSRGEVAGQSDLAGDQTFQPFLWDGRSLRDLGTLGGDFGNAVWINEAGAVTGWATTAGNSAAHAFLWRNGVMTDLGAAPGDTCSFPESINDRDQVVGHSGLCGTPESAYRGTLWERGAAYSLDALVAPSALSVLDGLFINDRGEIVGYGVLPNGDQHVILLVPAVLAAIEGLTSNAPAPGTIPADAAPRASAAPCANVLPWKAPLATWRARLAHRSQAPCLAG